MSNSIPGRAGWIPQYPFIPLLCLLIAGVVLQQYLPSLPGLCWTGALLFFTLCSIAVHFPKNVTSRISLLRRTCFAFMIVALGAALCYYRDVQHAPDWYGRDLAHTEALVLQLDDPPQDKPRTQLLPARVIRVLRNKHWQNASGYLNVYVYRSDSMPRYTAGMQLLIPGELAPLQSAGNPFAFDYARYAARNGIFHQAFLSSGSITILLQRQTGGSDAMATLRGRLLRCINDNVRDSGTRSLIAATLLNERSSLDERLWQAYSITGIVHIIAISGMHITILFSILLFLLSWFRYKRYDWIKYLLALPLVWGYIALTGFPPSAVRAAVGFTLLAAGICLRKEGNAINTWAATAFLLLSYNPYWLWDVGVQLSFLAVLSILLFYKPVRRWIAPRGKLLQATWDTFAVSIAAQILVFPLVLYYFHQFPLLGLAASLPAAVYSSILMVGSLLLFVLDTCFGSCIWLGDLLGWLTGIFHGIILRLAALTPAWIRHLFLSAIDYWLMMAVVISLCIYCFNRKNRYVYAGMASCCLLLCSFIVQDIAALRAKRLVVYNTARQGLVDCYSGKNVVAIGLEDSLDARTYNYTLFPARLGYRALAGASVAAAQSCRTIGNARVVYLKEDLNFKTGARFPADYLVLSTRCRYRGDRWLTVFAPKLVILDGSLSRAKAKRWKARLQALGVAVHWVQEDGAWILPGS